MIDGAAEIAALALALGIMLALVCYLVTNLSPGGMISPGWLALVLIDNPKRLVLIGGVILLTYFALLALQRVVILYGKRLFATVVMAGVFIQTGLFLFLIRPFPGVFGLTTLGFIVPGLIAYQLLRQPILPTLAATATVTAISYMIVLSGILLRFIPASSESLGLQTLAIERFTPLRLSIAGAVALAGLGALVVQLRNVSRAIPIHAGGPGVPGRGREVDPLGYISASERPFPRRDGSSHEGDSTRPGDGTGAES